MTTIDEHTLLSFIARRYISAREDAATDSLGFILNRSDSARAGITEFLREIAPESPDIVAVGSRIAGSDTGIPDLACFDCDGNVVALVESKFWAQLTPHQPVSYWRSLQQDVPSVLLVVAPAYRVSETNYLWDELESRLQAADHELQAKQRTDQYIHASGRGDQRHMVLATWDELIDRMQRRAHAHGSEQAVFELAELRGLATNVAANDDPGTDANLKGFVDEAIVRLAALGWGDTTGLSTGQSAGRFYVRYVCLAGAYAWFGIEYRAWRQMPDKPLWLSFYSDDGDVPVDEARLRLGNRAGSGLEWRPREVCLPIQFTYGADDETILREVVDQLISIGRTIDPEGPTYHEV